MNVEHWRHDERLVKRFWSKVNKEGPVPAHRQELGNCWVWTSSISGKQYGGFGIGGTTYKTNRVCWALQTGVWSKLCICHKCDNRLCVRPDHLFEGTQAENMRDCSRKGRLFKPEKSGERNGVARLTDEKVRQLRAIRARDGLTMEELGKLFGVHPATACSAINGKTWSHVK